MGFSGGICCMGFMFVCVVWCFYDFVWGYYLVVVGEVLGIDEFFVVWIGGEFGVWFVFVFLLSWDWGYVWVGKVFWFGLDFSV